MKEIKLQRKRQASTSGQPLPTRFTLANAWTSNRPHLRMCVGSFSRYFQVPRGCSKVTLVFTKHPHPEAYKMEMGYYGNASEAQIPMLDGFEPNLMWHSRVMFKKLWDEGYNYVRCEVPE
jgi:hypothetical protein